MKHVCPVCQHEMIGEPDAATKTQREILRYASEQIDSAIDELNKAQRRVDAVLEAVDA